MGEIEKSLGRGIDDYIEIKTQGRDLWGYGDAHLDISYVPPAPTTLIMPNFSCVLH